ncbi:TlpA disulfide reductase family protein [Pedobacter nyackensis]|uniref:Thiol-disulfide isomerase or thioredoxin n=1 Tax=Pedobacter nyackensis TaxID=475255 RepID=A0A1W2AJS0_9SPHI|nr:TlpA disulfide reductase family protein [Pedobacter nyackensis]SMC60906.1 Thiol-disulfide isomerase or thioredoxin [Pedobacter nyackensis]
MKKYSSLKKQLLVITGLWICSIPIYAQRSIKIGDKAPEISVKHWLKGEPIKNFENGKVYVVEFWATWCKPCIELMPHLGELARQYKDKVQVIGINILDRTPKDKIASFVREMGDKIDYTVGLDDGTMSENWFISSGSTGIPTSFIVDQQGKIAWYGNSGLDVMLAKVLNGETSYDLTEKTKPGRPGIMRYLMMPQSEEINLASEKLYEFIEKKDYDKALAYYDALCKDSAAVAAGVVDVYFEALINIDQKKSLSFYKNLIQNEDRWQYWVTWIVVNKEGLSKEFYLHAKKLLEPTLLDKSWLGQPLLREALPEVYFRLGEKDKAIDTIQDWIDKLKQLEGGEYMLKLAEGRLKRYKDSKMH